MTRHEPIRREPRRLRPPHEVSDDRLDHLATTDPTAWRRARSLDRLAALCEPLAGLEVTDVEHRVLDHLADVGEIHGVAVLAGLLWRAREAEPPSADR
ncbi:MAG: hypothetical protein L0K86_24670 [Actinomycetia bacterium]|nr:hypothetical protein [Actinomycetes bacterium]